MPVMVASSAWVIFLALRRERTVSARSVGDRCFMGPPWVRRDSGAGAGASSAVDRCVILNDIFRASLLS